MNDQEKKIAQNKLIITVVVLVLVFVLCLLCLLNSEINGGLSFRPAHSIHNGEPIGFAGSMLYYLLLLWLVGMVFSGVIYFAIMLLWTFLHRKDQVVYKKRYSPYEEELHYGAKIAFISAYVATFVLLALHVGSLITIKLF